MNDIGTPPPNDEKIRDLKAEVFDLSKEIQKLEQRARSIAQVIVEKEKHIAELEGRQE